MSTLKVNAIRGTGASSDAISVNSTNGTCTAKITNNLSNRNLIINGAFQIAQRATTNNTAGASSTYKTLDRWMMQIQAGTITESQQTLTSSDTGPWEKGFRNYMRLLNQSGVGAGVAQYVQMDQFVEAQDLANSGWDYTSTSSYITLSFWVRASIAQSYVAVIVSQDGTQRHYPFEIKDSGGSTLSANTWTKISKTIPGNSGITVNNDNGKGLAVSFIPYYGTNYTSNSGSFNAWNTTGSGLNRWPDMTTTWATTANATFDVTGVQLEVGDVATEFEHRSYGYELERCKRYYIQFGGSTDETNRILFEGYTKSTSYVINTHLSYSMRAAPAVTYTTGWSENNFGSISFNYRDTNQCAVRLIASANDTCCFTHTDADSYLKLDAEFS